MEIFLCTIQELPLNVKSGLVSLYNRIQSLIMDTCIKYFFFLKMNNV
uniref:Uncharacterized protein n=1 Tax=Rhizophora mucronata TaxID=61149 RepID=A0A2P2NFQ0_RHIMU